MEVSRHFIAGAHESIAPGDDATPITSTVVQPTTGGSKNLSASEALITVEDNSARFTVDGTTPTNSNGDSSDVGHLIAAGQSYVIEGVTNVKNFKVIDAATGVNAVIKVTTAFVEA